MKLEALRSKLVSVVLALRELSPQQRVELFDPYCKFCGGSTPCTCMKDE